MRALLFLVTLVLLSAGNLPSVSAEETPSAPVLEEPGQDKGLVVVTSVSSCLEKLPEEDATDIRLNFERPYQECRRRLQILEQKKRHKKAGELPGGEEAPGATQDTEAESPRNYVRVQGAKRNSPFAKNISAEEGGEEAPSNKKAVDAGSGKLEATDKKARKQPIRLFSYNE